MRPSIAAFVFMATVAAVTLTPSLACAYVGPPLVVHSQGTSRGSNANLHYAVDDSLDTAARLGYSRTYYEPGGWVIYTYADGHPRLVTAVSWRMSFSSRYAARLTVIGPDGTDLATIQVEARQGQITFEEPLLVLSYKIEAYGPDSVYVYDIQPTAVELTAPGVPAGLRAAEVSHTRVRLVWTAPADGGPVTAYKVYRDGLHLANVDTTSYVDTDVAPLTKYTYEVSAVGPGGESPRSGPLVVTTPEEPVIPPPEPPTGLQVTPTVAGLRVSWSPSPSADVVGYRVYLDGDLVFETSETTVTLTDLEPGRTYHVAVTAVAVDGRESPATTGSGEPFDVPQEPPGPVQAVRARVGARHVELVWTSPAVGGVATEYQVYRDGVLLGTTTDTRWVDSTVEPDTEYLYVIVAANDVGTSEPVELTVRTPPAGLLEGANPGLPGLGREVGSGIGLLLQPWLVAAGFILARVILTRGLRWVGVWRRG